VTATTHRQPHDLSDHQAQFRLTLFGDFSLCYGDAAEVIGLGRKTRGLIAYLALTRGAETRERLATLFWERHGFEQARASLRQACYELRKALPGPDRLLVFERDGIALVRENYVTDIDDLLALHDPGPLLAVLGQERIVLLRDLDGLSPAFDDWLMIERAQRDEERLNVAIAVARRAMDDSNLQVAETVASRLIATDPFAELPAQLVIEIRTRAGDRDGARRAYERHADVLRRELGVSPSAAMVKLFDEMPAVPSGGRCGHSGDQRFRALEPTRERDGTDGRDVAVRRHGWTRRAAWVGLAGATTAVASLAWLRSSRYTPDPRAVELYQRGQAIQKAGVLETMGEAIEAYKQAAAIDPRYADAWGALALCYRYRAIGPLLRLGDPQDVRAAAKRALALDPDNADARLALIILYPCYRRCQEDEAQLRTFLRDHPDSAVGHVRLGELLFNVGRIEDAVSEVRRAIGIDPSLQVAWVDLAFALYYAGRDGEGDLAIEDARSRWPQDWRLYVGGYYLLLCSKRYDEAIEYLRDTSRLPRVLGPEMVEGWTQETDAFASGRGLAALKNKFSVVAQPASSQIEAPWFAAPGLALFGWVDEMFAYFEAFYFGGVINGTRIAPPGPLDPRPTYPLFAPAVLSLRNDPRFASLLARTGLENYWHKAGIQPDFRRG
jgi:DNA-binding SARP family transcriptional activator/Tfp pilus assembly protein PilF